jgi:ABC-type sulfate transport system permease subunit
MRPAWPGLRQATDHHPTSAARNVLLAHRPAGQTQTLPLFVEDAYKQYDTELAYGAALVLAGVALVSLLLKLVVEQVLGGVKESKTIP